VVDNDDAATRPAAATANALDFAIKRVRRCHFRMFGLASVTLVDDVWVIRWASGGMTACQVVSPAATAPYSGFSWRISFSEKAAPESTVSRYMIRRPRARSRGWKAFCQNHRTSLAANDLSIMPPVFWVLVILRLPRREIVRIAVTRHRTAEWLASRCPEAFP
jgi:hypothetical protein